MYGKIKKIVPLAQSYTEQLIEKGLLKAHQVEEFNNKLKADFEKSLENSKKNIMPKTPWIIEPKIDLIEEPKAIEIGETGVNMELLKNLSLTIHTLPDEMKFHDFVKNIYQKRLSSIQEEKNIDMVAAEDLAFATLLLEGFRVRLSGQDIQRGSISHRHCVITEQAKGQKYVPMRAILNMNKHNRVNYVNSPLNESGVLGFEYGYSITNPNSLVIWNAIDGDFANEAQVIIDNYITSGEQKWAIQSGLVMLLPHSFEGFGPEHSNARIERLLQTCNDDPFEPNFYVSADEERAIMKANMQVCIPTTAANYFHLLRRQFVRHFRKPLAVLYPKRVMLKNPEVTFFLIKKLDILPTDSFPGRN